MDRRKFIGALGLAGAGAAISTASAQTAAGAQVNWRLVSSFPNSIDTVFDAPVEMADRVREASGGQFDIKVYAAGEIVGGLEVLDAVQDGTVEAGHTISAYFIGKDPTFGISTGLPFGMNARQQTSWMMQGGGLELLREFFGKSNIVNFPCGNTGTQMGGWLRREIKSVADLDGLKFRIGGLAGRALSKLGVVPQQIPASDIYTSLERGTIDAAEWVGPYDDEKLGLNAVAPYYYYPGFWEGGAQVDLLVNKAAWDALSPEYQAMLTAAAAEAHVNLTAKYDARNPAALRRLVAAGAQLKPYPNEVMQAAFQAVKEVMGEISAENEGFAKIFESYTAWQRDQYFWASIADARYDVFMVGAMQAQSNQ
jgi:TRAP-type mannitol/chloroaromatic compound transport system substrate-binding protein